MPYDQLKEKLLLLQAEITDLEAENPELSPRLQVLLEELQSQLDISIAGEEGGIDEQYHSDSEQLQDLITQFEVSHPSLTLVLNDVLVKLGNIGV